MPIPTIATGASTRFHSSRLIEAGHPERAEVEAFIAQVYAERYGARLTSFLPRLLAFRDAQGVLHSVYDFIVGAPYVCGTGPGHYSVLSSQTSDWIPLELLPWGKLPGWVAAHLKKTGATQAFMVPAARLKAVKAEFNKR